MASNQMFRTLSPQTLFAVVAGHKFDTTHILHVLACVIAFPLLCWALLLNGKQFQLV